MPNISALGLDTSNYTTSAAFFGDGEMDSRGMILPVKEGEIGLRQSDAVFHHTRQLPEVLSMLGDKIGGSVRVMRRTPICRASWWASARRRCLRRR